jgi:hypothetical protein
MIVVITIAVATKTMARLFLFLLMRGYGPDEWKTPCTLNLGTRFVSYFWRMKYRA